ncbi:hypothetical protein C2G38_2035951 [Gigaspora rosea]|uniref:Uncharacterized protein n=1 Tax=Gigaspora rosea TaxID=44941 RepID=A0A397VCN6_9GLOM|nr:hypothetical protein C2G38_2035951 [Gigaspora rosea]
MSILCRYDPKGRHKNASDATKRKPIFSVAEELITLKKSMCIDCDVIEWSYPNQVTSKLDDKNKTTNDKKCRYDALEKLAEKFNKSPNKTSTQKDSTETEKETLQEQDRTKRLRTTMNEVKDKLNNPNEHNRTGEPSNDQSPQRFENLTGNPHSDEKAKSVQDAEMHDNTDSP